MLMEKVFARALTEVDMLTLRRIFILLWLLWLPGCEAMQSPLNLGLDRYSGYAPLFVSDSLGELQTDGIRLQMFPSSREVARALRHRQIDVAVLTLDEAIVVSRQRPELRIITTVVTSRGAEGLLLLPPLTPAEGLKGQGVAYDSETSAAYLLALALKQHGLVPGDIRSAPMFSQVSVPTDPRSPSAALVTHDPLYSQLLQAQAVALYSSADLPLGILHVLVAPRDFLVDREPHLSRLLDRLAASCAALVQAPEAVLVHTRNSPYAPVVQHWAATHFAYPSSAENRAILLDHPEILQRRIQAMEADMSKQQLLAEGNPWNPAFEPALLQDILP